MACQGFLVREACIGILVGGAGSPLWSAMKCPVVSFEVPMDLVRLLATCILMLRVMFLHCWRFSLVCLALKLAGSWVELGFIIGMEVGNVPWSQEFSGIPTFWI